MTTLLRMGIPS